MRILTKQEQGGFDALRARDYAGEATEEEKAEIERLSQKIIAAEEAYLAPAIARMAERNAAAEQRLRAQEIAIERMEALLKRLTQIAQELEKERDALRAARKRTHSKSKTGAVCAP